MFYMSEDGILHSHSCENLKSYKVKYKLFHPKMQTVLSKR
jgi:hypothetical protein